MHCREKTTSAYRVFGVEVEQPPGLVHEIREVVEHHEAHAEDTGAAVFQSVVLRGDGLGKAQLEVSGATWGRKKKGAGERR